jgi:hypothetical protein
LVWEKFSGQANTQKIINFWQDVVAGKLWLTDKIFYYKL